MGGLERRVGSPNCRSWRAGLGRCRPSPGSWREYGLGTALETAATYVVTTDEIKEKA